MRTNIEINDKNMELALKYSGLSTKKDVINEALDFYTKFLLRMEMKKMKGSNCWEGDLEAIRTNSEL
jgi:Arc/MetJ family transcription regulator